MHINKLKTEKSEPNSVNLSKELTQSKSLSSFQRPTSGFMDIREILLEKSKPNNINNYGPATLY
jgi:hypothetical protein